MMLGRFIKAVTCATAAKSTLIEKIPTRFTDFQIYHKKVYSRGLLPQIITKVLLPALTYPGWVTAIKTFSSSLCASVLAPQKGAPRRMGTVNAHEKTKIYFYYCLVRALNTTNWVHTSNTHVRLDRNMI